MPRRSLRGGTAPGHEEQRGPIARRLEGRPDYLAAQPMAGQSFTDIGRELAGRQL
ncbi:hypothetical protein LRS11_21340 [Pseudomonas sp. J452]|nr:hypothetical protein [Pseudomonas sp. J452]UUY08306.1 hypothetical protein LRS11_21340 [Pseudomonas sp. J452]